MGGKVPATRQTAFAYSPGKRHVCFRPIADTLSCVAQLQTTPHQQAAAIETIAAPLEDSPGPNLSAALPDDTYGFGEPEMLRATYVAILASLQAGAVNQPRQPIAKPALEASQWIGFQSDPVGRMTVPVVINGRTHRFLVDTGAERTGISIEASDELGLYHESTRLVTGFGGSHWVPTVVLPILVMGKSKRRDVQVLALTGHAIGADGFLGIDVLADQLVEFDFKSRGITLRKAPRFVQPHDLGDASSKLHSRKGRLVFAKAIANRVEVQAVLDTGSSLTIANQALRKALEERGRLGATSPIHILAVTGELMPAELAIVRNLVVGGVGIRNLPIAFVTSEPFATLRLTEKPAMLLGMDALRVFDRVAVDFRNKTVRFMQIDRSGSTVVKFSSANMQ